jgi:hypothetical protein
MGAAYVTACNGAARVAAPFLIVQAVLHPLSGYSGRGLG